MNDDQKKEADRVTNLLFGEPAKEAERDLWIQLSITLTLYMFLDHCKNQPDPWKTYDEMTLSWRKTSLDSMLKDKAELDSIDILKMLGGSGLFGNIQKDYVKHINSVMTRLENLAKEVLPPRPREEDHE